MRLSSVLSLLLFVVSHCRSSAPFRILGLVPYNGKSHWYIFKPLFEELASRGNQVTVLSHYPRPTALKNYKDISMHDPNMPGMHTKNIENIGLQSRLREMHSVFLNGMNEVCGKGLQHPNVQKLLHSNDTYDVIVTEIFNADCFLGFVHKFRAPMVAVRTAPLSPWTNHRMANPDNPSFIPNSLLGKPSRMGFKDRLENFLGTLYYKAVYSYFNARCTRIARTHFGEDLPALEDIARNTSMILVNSHFSMQYARPLVSGIKEIGGIHIKKPKKLPKEIEEWIDGAEHGVIYFSIGSMLKLSSMSASKRNAFLQAFAELPQRILMKWEESATENLPGNVKIFKWVQQYDILCHPNVKVFITHAGMLSTTEAVYSGTPMIAIPVYGDQPTNAKLLEERGLAIVLEYPEITKDIILNALKKVLHDPKYQTTARAFSSVIRDRLVPPVEEAAYWVEYVARHNGAPFLRSPALDMPLYQYLLLDVIGTLLLLVVILAGITFLVLRSLLTLVKITCCKRAVKWKEQ